MGKVDFLGLHHLPPQTIGSRVAFSLFLFSGREFHTVAKISHIQHLPLRRYNSYISRAVSFYFKPFEIHIWVLDWC